MERQTLAELLAKSDPNVHCDLCPSFHVAIVDQKLDVRIHLDVGDQQWYSIDETTKTRLRQKFDELQAGGIRTADELEKFKLGAARALIHEVQSGCLFKDDRTEGDANGTEGQ